MISRTDFSEWFKERYPGEVRFIELKFNESFEDFLSRIPVISAVYLTDGSIGVEDFMREIKRAPKDTEIILNFRKDNAVTSP